MLGFFKPFQAPNNNKLYKFSQLYSKIMKLLDILAAKSKIKADILRILSNSEHLTPRQIYNNIKKRRKITYKGTHKAVRQLLDSGVLNQSSTKYFLSKDWINTLERDIIELRRSYEARHLVEKRKAEKNVLVTGSARGLGRAILLDLARDHNVVVHYNKSSKDAENTVKEAKKLNKAIKARADLRDEAQVKQMFRKIRQNIGNIDILINNVGDFIYTPINITSSKEFRNTIESNLYSAWHCIQQVIPYMRKKGGVIINFGCAGCDRMVIRKNTTPYYMAKTVLYMLTKAMAASEKNVRINMVSPGVLKSSRYRHDVKETDEIKFNDIINAIRFLISEEADKINGANVEVSNGWVPGFSN